MVGIIESTLREGAQAPGGYLDLDQKTEILAELDRIGIEEVEIGPVSAPDQNLPRLVAHVRRRIPRLRLSGWCRGLRGDVEAACALEVDVVAFCVPVSELHLRYRLRRTPDWAVQQVMRLTADARRLGADRVSVGLEDVTRADPEVLDRVVRAAAAAGVDRIRLADTVGVATPGTMAGLVRHCRAEFDGEVAVHTHNDFGMATANAISAMDAGADLVDTSLLGLGERAGIARTEEVCAYLAVTHGSRYRLSELRHLCHRVAGWIDRPVPADSPVIGERLFVCESGLHVDGLAKDPRTYQPYPPGLVGAVQGIRLGRITGRNAVDAVLRTRGLTVSPERIVEITSSVRAIANRQGRPLTDQEVLAVADGHHREAMVPETGDRYRS
jgi:homocitrate synthase NifV